MRVYPRFVRVRPRSIVRRRSQPRSAASKNKIHEEKLELVAVGGISFSRCPGWPLSYTPLFRSVCDYRIFPWANFLLFGIGGDLYLSSGSLRAFGKPKLYRGKVFGTILAGLSLLAFALLFLHLLLRIEAVSRPQRKRRGWGKGAGVHFARPRR